MNAAQTRAIMMVNALMLLMAIHVDVLRVSLEMIAKPVSTPMLVLRV